MNDRLPVGFIGLGDMGGPIAQRLIDAGNSVTLWARRSETLQQFQDGDYDRALTPADVARNSDVVGLCVFGDSDLRDVTVGPDGLMAGLRPGAVVLIHSTASVEICRELATKAAERGGHVLDAPVSGGRRGAQQGTLTIMVGGPAEVMDRAMPVMKGYGEIIRLMGPLGSGQRMKVLNNALSNSIGRISSVAIEIADGFGLDRAAVLDVLRTGGARSFSLTSLIERVMVDPDYARHAMTMIAKDTHLYQQIRREAGLAPTVLDVLAEERAYRIEPHLRADLTADHVATP